MPERCVHGMQPYVVLLRFEHRQQLENRTHREHDVLYTAVHTGLKCFNEKCSCKIGYILTKVQNYVKWSFLAKSLTTCVKRLKNHPIFQKDSAAQNCSESAEMLDDTFSLILKLFWH
jgi:hypothetical protein